MSGTADKAFNPAALTRETVGWCIDPFKLPRNNETNDDEAAVRNDSPPGRPVVIVNTDAHPFAGEQYLALSLTTKTWYADKLVEIPAEGWQDGEIDRQSYLVPWSVLSPQPDDIEFWIGVLSPTVIDEGVRALLPYLHPNPNQLID